MPIPATPTRQRGVALITVMVILLLSIISVLAVSRTELLNEALVGNNSDYGRALAAAEALVRDAETDILGRYPNGRMCRETAPGSDIPTPGFSRCRSTAGTIIPKNGEDFDNLRAALPAFPHCSQGICAPPNLLTLHRPAIGATPAFAIEDDLPTMGPLGTRFGTWTRPGLGLPPIVPANLDVNSILANDPADPNAPNQGWYWIEVLEYDVDAARTPAGPPLTDAQVRAIDGLKPDKGAPFIFRVTAVALGQKTGTRAVVRAFFVSNPTRDLN